MVRIPRRADAHVAGSVGRGWRHAQPGRCHLDRAGAGALGYAMEANGFPLAPAILGIVLGEIVEENFMTSMMKGPGRLAGLFLDRPWAAALGVLTLLLWVSLLTRGTMSASGADATP
ncbi:hypothetical protein DSL92_07960 [Billgrantia gudaonensis]|uniref:Uncharacterized protein n=1 Tax=Billgrantia gudaonensis TaxID=376427 RepID=A0A3S0NWL1_9GAMM|nr:hypothetical protein DSL92_07960 [Halomonas gudaonensis]